MPTTYTLKPHVDNPPVDLSVVASLSRPEKAKWLLAYDLEGSTEPIIFPKPSSLSRGGDLWQETCFEFFVRHPDGEYLECNFSPSGQWACFSFAGYRRRMKKMNLQNDPKILVDSSAGRFRLEVLLDFNGVDLSKYLEPELLISLTIVIKMRDQRYCYYAMNFPDGQADFHHLDGFWKV